jgi:RNA polymerase sigma factor (sigma-70 family)
MLPTAASPSGDDDATLLGRASSDVGAFEEIYRHYVRRVTAFAVHHCRTPDDVADVVSDTFLTLLERCERYDPERGSVSSFVHSIARSMVLDQHRRVRRLGRLAARAQGRRLLAPDDIARLEDAMDAGHRLEALRIPMAQLSAREHQLLLLASAGLTPSEAARELGITPEAARARLARVRRKLPATGTSPPSPLTPNPMTPEEDARSASHP